MGLPGRMGARSREAGRLHPDLALAALVERDAAAAEERMRRHAERTARLVRGVSRTIWRD
ncbi:hypothetical protein GCM10018954_054220 [Kutzneria kofuensis]